MKRLKFLILAFIVFYSILFTVVETVALTKPLYFQKYRKYGVEKLDYVQSYDVERVTDEIILYLAGWSQDMNRQSWFGEVENRHMKDVRNLFTLGRILRTLLLIPLVILFRSLSSETDFFVRFIRAYAGWITILGGISLIGVLNFSKSFVIFHHIFFNNDDWILNPEESIIINLMPQGFFADMGRDIIILFLGINILFLFHLYLVYNTGKTKTDFSD